MNRVERFSQWRGRNVLPIDIISTLAIAFFAVGVAASTGDTPGILFAHDATSQIIWSLVSLVPVMFRRWRPQAAALCYAGLVALHLIFGPAMLYSDFLALVMVYSVIVYGDPRNTKAFIVLAAAFGLFATMAITWSVDVGPAFGQVWVGYRQMYYGACNTVYQEGLNGDCSSILLSEGFQMGLLVAACLVATIVLAYWQRARQATIRMLRERNEAIAVRQDEERRIAALAERARIARDMHDVVAHTLSIIIVQSDGGRYAGVGNPAVARSTMETIRRESERALHDMKRLLGVFGGSSHADYDDITALVDQARETSPGTAIVRRIEGTAAPQRLGAQASVAVYRVVQEALTNVRKYAGPRPTVCIDEHWDDDGLSLTIADNGRGASSGLDGHAPGYGLIGMRERVAAVGGTVNAGPGIGGGFVVSVTIPYAAAPDAAADSAVGMSRSSDVATAAAQTAVPPSGRCPRHRPDDA
ncbi:sensor histidine kinase [Bifidobacterium pullorum]|uniref:sensor histidine kinase n=1 Tax=Bifidobacterium pullorum TaxID=78448 RepID=UPI003AB5B869